MTTKKKSEKANEAVDKLKELNEMIDKLTRGDKALWNFCIRNTDETDNYSRC